MPKASPLRTSKKRNCIVVVKYRRVLLQRKKQKTKKDTGVEKVTMIYPLIHKQLKITRPGKTNMLKMKHLTTMMKVFLLTIMFTQKKSKRNILHFVSSNGDDQQMMNSELG
jgi:hypothetical protein